MDAKIFTVFFAIPAVVLCAVDLTSLNHVQAGPKANSYVYISGQNMSFVCNSTERVIWTIPAVDVNSAGAFSSKGNSRITTTDANNDVFPSDITILEAASGDSNTTVTCQDGSSTLIEHVVTIFVEGAPECPVPTLTSTTDSSLSISWVPPPTLLAVQYYLLDVNPAVDSVNGTQNISSTSFTVTGLQPSTEYAISVDACTEAGCSSGCMQLFPTGPFWEDSFVSVCSSSGSEPTITVFVQYMPENGTSNATATSFLASINGLPSSNVTVSGPGEFPVSFSGVTAGAEYTVSVQPSSGASSGNTVSRSLTVSAVATISTNADNYTVSCVDTCVGPLSVLSCLTNLTCGSSSTEVTVSPGSSVEQTAGDECVTCTAYTVASLSAGQLNFSQSDTGLRLGDACDDLPVTGSGVGLPPYAIAIIIIGAIILAVIVLVIVIIVVVVIFRLCCNRDKLKGDSSGEELKKVEKGDGRGNSNNNSVVVVEEISPSSDPTAQPLPDPEHHYSVVNKKRSEEILVYADLKFDKSEATPTPPPSQDRVVYSEISQSQEDLQVAVPNGN